MEWLHSACVPLAAFIKSKSHEGQTVNPFLTVCPHAGHSRFLVPVILYITYRKVFIMANQKIRTMMPIPFAVSSAFTS